MPLCIRIVILDHSQVVMPMNFHSYHDSRSLRMHHLPQKTFPTSRSLTYTYYSSTKPASAKPTLLLLHGWPDSAHLWASLSSSLADLPFPVLIPGSTMLVPRCDRETSLRRRGVSARKIKSGRANALRWMYQRPCVPDRYDPHPRVAGIIAKFNC